MLWGCLWDFRELGRRQNHTSASLSLSGERLSPGLKENRETLGLFYQMWTWLLASGCTRKKKNPFWGPLSSTQTSLPQPSSRFVPLWTHCDLWLASPGDLILFLWPATETAAPTTRWHTPNGKSLAQQCESFITLEKASLLNKQSFSACNSKPLHRTQFVQGISFAA